jgi:hypothetical protein
VKKIIIYTVNDELFTLPLIKKICIDLSKKFSIDIFIGKPTLKRKLKVLLTFVLFGSPFELINLFKKRVGLNGFSKIKNTNIINNDKKKYYFGLSMNYPKKIVLKNYDIFNFHLGNFSNQRGSFIFFYKYFYKWKNLDLTFHKINNSYDSGSIIEKKTSNIKKKNATDICLLNNNNYKFVKKCITQLKKKGKKKFLHGKLNTEPSFYLIIKVYISTILKLH